MKYEDRKSVYACVKTGRADRRKRKWKSTLIASVGCGERSVDMNQLNENRKQMNE
jgi:hypothetical protein